MILLEFTGYFWDIYDIYIYIHYIAKLISNTPETRRCSRIFHSQGHRPARVQLLVYPLHVRYAHQVLHYIHFHMVFAGFL